MAKSLAPRPHIPIRRLGKSSEKIETAITLIDAGIKVFNFGKNFHRSKFSFSVTVSEKDDLYQEVNDWLLRILPNEKHRTLSVKTDRNSGRYEDSVAPEKKAGEKIDPLVVMYDSKSSRVVRLEGHRVEIDVYTPEVSDKKYTDMFDMHRTIRFTTFSYGAQQAVIRQLEALNQQRKTERKATLKMINSWGDWRTRSDLPPRTMGSVSLPKEQKERIVADMRGFLDAEDQYNRLAIPWHRGYMLYGPPGTGKTSLVKALANEFNLDLWYISLSDLKTENSLLSLLAHVGPRSLLLLEDIDTIKITHDRDSSEAGTISMGSLLNTLDGVATPHGLITIMTTNRFDILDPALTRAGRMDLVEELTYPSKTTIRDMFEHFYGDTTMLTGIGENVFVEKKISTSQIAEIMKRNLEDPKQAVVDIKKLVKEA
jgi:chaperone BCS1